MIASVTAQIISLFDIITFLLYYNNNNNKFYSASTMNKERRQKSKSQNDLLNKKKRVDCIGSGYLEAVLMLADQNWTSLINFEGISDGIISRKKGSEIEQIAIKSIDESSTSYNKYYC